MSEKSILEMVGGEKHINPHYNIKAEKIGSYWKKDKSKMTEEEINKKAEIHCNEVLCNAHEKCNEVIKCRDWRSRRAGFFCGYEQALKDFEKENAELKESLKKWKDAIYADVENYNDQLTRAKELLKEFNLVLKERGLYHNGLYKRTEQFLSEVEK